MSDEQQRKDGSSATAFAVIGAVASVFLGAALWGWATTVLRGLPGVVGWIFGFILFVLAIVAGWKLGALVGSWLDSPEVEKVEDEAQPEQAAPSPLPATPTARNEALWPQHRTRAYRDRGMATTNDDQEV